MKTLALKPDELRVDTFVTDTVSPGLNLAAAALRTTTRDPKDCPETLPQFCTTTALCL